ncbi:hypothetical protein ACLB2K_040450 [Fragaria x ananassa]
MVGSHQPNQDVGSALPSEQILQAINDLRGQMIDFSAQAKQDRDLLQATHDKLATLGEDYGHLDTKFTETKSLVEGSLQWIRSDLDQNTETVKQHAEILSLTRATIDEQTRRLDDHDTKLHDQ